MRSSMSRPEAGEESLANFLLRIEILGGFFSVGQDNLASKELAAGGSTGESNRRYGIVPS